MTAQRMILQVRNLVSAAEDAHDDKLAIEDTMIGYDGDDSQMDMDLNVDDGKNDPEH